MTSVLLQLWLSLNFCPINRFGGTVARLKRPLMTCWMQKQMFEKKLSNLDPGNSNLDPGNFMNKLRCLSSLIFIDIIILSSKPTRALRFEPPSLVLNKQLSQLGKRQLWHANAQWDCIIESYPGNRFLIWHHEFIFSCFETHPHPTEQKHQFSKFTPPGNWLTKHPAVSAEFPAPLLSKEQRSHGSRQQEITFWGPVAMAENDKKRRDKGKDRDAFKHGSFSWVGLFDVLRSLSESVFAPTNTISGEVETGVLLDTSIPC